MLRHNVDEMLSEFRDNFQKMKTIMEICKIWETFNVLEIAETEWFFKSSFHIELNHPPNFERLVLCCIEADVCTKIVQNTRWNKDLARKRLESSWRDLQDLHAFAPLRPQYFSKSSSNILAFSTLEMLTSLQCFSNFVVIFFDFDEMFSDFLRFSRKCRKTLQLLEIPRFQFNFHHDYTRDSFNFRFDFQFNLI